jgi:hypothetical protein
MSMNRLLLRALVVGALKDQTIAGARVYDTRLAPVPTDKVENIIPMIAVYTDIDRRRQMERGAPAGSFKRSCDITLEISLGTWLQATAPDGSPQAAIGVLETDAELEALLDLFELQIFRALYSSENAFAVDLQSMVKEWLDWESMPGRTVEGNNKIAGRVLTITVEVADDCRPAGDGRTVTVRSNPIPTAAPYLASLVTKIGNEPALASLSTMLGHMLGTTALPAVDTLERFGFALTYGTEPDGGAPIEFPVDADAAPHVED